MPLWKSGTDDDHIHRDVSTLLPWYVNRTLETPELTRVEQHLRRCMACQDELVRWQRIETAVRLAEEPLPSATRTGFAALMAQLDATEIVRPQPRHAWESLRRMLRYYGARLAALPRFAHLALAVECALIVLLAGMLLWRSQSGSDGLYTTLSRPPEVRALQQGQIRLVVADRMSVGELRTLLNSVQATIIQGPSALGVYTVEVPLANSRPETLQAILAALRAHPQVRLAEPVSAP